MQPAIVIALAYAGLGLLVAVTFLFGAVKRTDAFAREGSLGFRLVVLPGAVALWPLLLARLVQSRPPPVESNAHRRAAAPEGRGGSHR